MSQTTNNFDVLMNATEADYELQCKTAKLLGVSIEEYLDFVRDMAVDTVEYTLEEIEIMYDDYISQGYADEVPMPTYEDYACIDRMGWN